MLYAVFHSKNSVLLSTISEKSISIIVLEIAHTVFDSKNSENAFLSVTHGHIQIDF
jgi:hypothetical protein